MSNSVCISLSGSIRPGAASSDPVYKVAQAQPAPVPEQPQPVAQPQPAAQPQQPTRKRWQTQQWQNDWQTRYQNASQEQRRQMIATLQQQRDQQNWANDEDRRRFNGTMQRLINNATAASRNAAQPVAPAPAATPAAATPPAPADNSQQSTPEWQNRSWQNDWSTKYRNATRDERGEMRRQLSDMRAGMNDEEGKQFDKVVGNLKNRYKQTRTGIFLPDGREWQRGGSTTSSDGTPAMVYPNSYQDPETQAAVNAANSAADEYRRSVGENREPEPSYQLQRQAYSIPPVYGGGFNRNAPTIPQYVIDNYYKDKMQPARGRTNPTAGGYGYTEIPVTISQDNALGKR